MIKTDDIKKGMRCRLHNGWIATMMDNRRGNIRTLLVEGYETEQGDCFAHDIAKVYVNLGRAAEDVSYTPSQNKLRERLATIGL